MKMVLRIVGIILAAIGCLFLVAGRSAATDSVGTVVWLVMGGLPLAVGIFLIWKSMQSSDKKAAASPEPPAPEVTKAASVTSKPSADPVPKDSSVTIPVPEASTPPKKEPADKPKYKSYLFKVAGISRRQRDITDNLMTESYDYGLSKKELVEIGMIDERIYKYDPIMLDAELVPEPDNPKDPNAIKVIVDDILLGYVPADETEKVKKLLDTKQIQAVSCEFYGGPYKIITEDYDYDKDKEVYNVEKESQYIGAEVTIEYE